MLRNNFAMRLVLHSTNEFKVIDGKPHRIWTTLGVGNEKIHAYIDQIDVPPGNSMIPDFERDLGRVETKEI
jgi:hypothetical protein